MRTIFLIVATIASFFIVVSSRSAFAGDERPLAKAPFNGEQAKGFQDQWAGYIGEPVVETNSIGMKMTLVPPGEFLMGTTEREFAQTMHEMVRSPKDHFRVYLTVLRCRSRIRATLEHTSGSDQRSRQVANEMHRCPACISL